MAAELSPEGCGGIGQGRVRKHLGHLQVISVLGPLPLEATPLVQPSSELAGLSSSAPSLDFWIRPLSLFVKAPHSRVGPQL